MEEVTQCPQRYLDANTHDLFFAADQAEKGIWPLAGGWMDQTEVAVRGVRLVINEREARRMPNG